jgi:hypothetical protein
VRVPGSGVYHRQDTYSKVGRSGGGRQARAPVAAAPVYPKAGLLAPKAEKMFVQGVTAYMRGWYADGLAAFQDVDGRDQGMHVFIRRLWLPAAWPSEPVMLRGSMTRSRTW